MTNFVQKQWNEYYKVEDKDEGNFWVKSLILEKLSTAEEYCLHYDKCSNNRGTPFRRFSY